jgi:hypothetical protein
MVIPKRWKIVSGTMTVAVAIGAGAARAATTDGSEEPGPDVGLANARTLEELGPLVLDDLEDAVVTILDRGESVESPFDSIQSADSVDTADSVQSPDTADSVQSPDTPDSVQSPDGPDSPDTKSPDQGSVGSPDSAGSP